MALGTMASRPVLSLVLITMIVSALVMPAGIHPVSDVDARLRVSHWLWTGHMTPAPPPIQAGDDPDAWQWPAGLRGRDGTLHPWYGVGESLLLLPADVIASAAGAVFKPLAGENPRRLIVWYLFFPLCNGLGIAAAYLLLRALEIDRRDAALGALSLLFGTTYLWHAQNIQENTQLFLFTAAAFWAVLRWSQTNRPQWLSVAGALVSFNLLTRLPAIADVAGVAMFALVLGRRRRQFIWTAASRLGLPILCAGALDRIYHWYRFGTWTGTYMALHGAEMQRLNPRLPAAFPFNGSFADGFLGVFFSPAKSVFLFDPLLCVTVVLAVWQWRKLTPAWRAYLAAMSVILLITAAGYATFYNWDGEAAWGDRFTTTPVFGLALVAIPLALRAGISRVAIAGVSALACALQMSSVIFPSWVEAIQNGRGHERFGLLPGCDYSTSYFVIKERLINIWSSATTGVPSTTCDGRPAGSPVMVWGLQPLKSLSIGARLGVRSIWLAGLGSTVLLARRLARRS